MKMAHPKLYDQRGHQVLDSAVHLHLPEHERRLLNESKLLDAQVYLLQTAIHDALGALDRDEVDMARRALKRVETDGMKLDRAATWRLIAQMYHALREDNRNVA